jgi:putative restriction endonuclease
MNDNQQSLLKQLQALKVWRRDGERAPHKPLLLLLALAACSRGEPRLMLYAEIDKPLQELLREFGPPRKSFHSEYPFWRLQNDGIWELDNLEHLQTRASNDDAKKSELLKFGVCGGFTQEIYELLSNDGDLIRRAAFQLLEAAFPDSYHDDILAAVGLTELFENTQRRKRDPKFREIVLMAYEYQCAVCGLDLRLGGRELGLEAAHIKWHQAGGPDTANNGLALCSLHHKLLDRGAIGITADLRVQVSQLTTGNSGFLNWVMPFHGANIRTPQTSEYVLNREFVDWHRNEVFRAPARYCDNI